MTLVYLILAILSGIFLSLIFLRRLRMTQSDLRFQRHLAEEEAAEKQDLPEQSSDASEKAKEATKKPSTKRLFNQAEAHLKKGAHDEAEALLIEIISIDNAHLEAHHRLGMIKLKQENFPEAELYFSKLVNLKKDPVYFSNLGAALYQQQRLVEAAEAYENAIALDNRRANRLLSAAQVYLELGEDEKALHYFELAARKKSKDNELRVMLAEYYEKLELYGKALEHFKKAHSLDPYNKEIAKRIKAIEAKLD